MSELGNPLRAMVLHYSSSCLNCYLTVKQAIALFLGMKTGLRRTSEIAGLVNLLRNWAACVHHSNNAQHTQLSFPFTHHSLPHSLTHSLNSTYPPNPTSPLPHSIMPSSTTKKMRTKRPDTRPNEKERRKIGKQIEDQRKIEEIRVTRKRKSEHVERVVQRAPEVKQSLPENEKVRVCVRECVCE